MFAQETTFGQSIEDGNLRSGLAKTLLAATLVAIGVYAAFFALSLVSLRTDRTALAVPINAAFGDGALDSHASWLQGDTGIGAHQYNDCLILYQALDDRAPVALRALSPLSVPLDTDNACSALAAFASGAKAPPVRFYHQYLHAHTALARLLVPPLGVAGVRGLYKLAITLTLLAGIGYALLGLVHRRSIPDQIVWLAIFLVFSRWFGLESFGQSLGHGPADLIPLVFLLFLQRASATVPITPRTAIIASATFGALTMQFEFLTGGIPLGLSVVIGALPLALPCRGDMAITVIRSAFAYITAIAATAAAKLALVAIVFGPPTLIDLGHQFLFRTGIGSVASRDVPIGWGEYWRHDWAGIEALAPGMHLLAVGMLVVAVSAAGWGYSQLRVAANAGMRLRAVALLASMLVPPLWMVVFWQHTAEHAWFMDRILVWIIAAGGALFVLAVAQGPSTAALSFPFRPTQAREGGDRLIEELH